MQVVPPDAVHQLDECATVSAEHGLGVKLMLIIVGRGEKKEFIHMNYVQFILRLRSSDPVKTASEISIEQ